MAFGEEQSASRVSGQRSPCLHGVGERDDDGERQALGNADHQQRDADDERVDDAANVRVGPGRLVPGPSESEHATSPGTPFDPRDKYATIKKHELIYRITAIALGRKAGTQVVLTSLFIPFPKYQN